MNAIEELLSKRWIVKKQNPQLYYQVKDHLKEVKKIVQEKLGYIVISNPNLIKIEKIPGKPEPWMGIKEFTSIQEYQMLCYVLMFLEDKEKEEQFVLSSLTDYIQSQFTNQSIDWTHFITRRRLVKVLKYCVNQFILIQNDGEEDRFTQDINTEVLYENTGMSRFYVRNFMRDIMEYNNPKDFEQSEWINVNEDRGIVRRQRIYRRLLLSPGVYRNDDENEDFGYIRNYRNQILNDFNQMFSCSLHVHKSSAYLNLSEECSMGKSFPFNQTLSDLILVVNTALIQNYSKNITSLEEALYLSKDKYRQLCKKTIKQNIKFLPKKYQDMEMDQIIESIQNEMIRLGFMEIKEDELVIYPIAGKIIGEISERL